MVSIKKVFSAKGYRD